MQKKITTLIILLIVSSCVKIQKKDEIKNDLIPTTEDIVIENTPEKETIKIYLDSEISLTQDMEINADEIYLTANAKIYTNQFNFKMNATNIFSELGSCIQNFSDQNKVALLSTAGLNAGAVNIKANKAEGRLQINMNGQGGGDGKGGWTAFTVTNNNPRIRSRSACAPGSGKPAGQSGSLFLDLKLSDQLFLSYTMTKAAGGRIGIIDTDYAMEFDPNRATNYKFFRNIEDDCNEIAIAGQDGQPGLFCMKFNVNESARCEKM